MRALWLLMAISACASDPSIACTSEDQCLSGQQCMAGWCTAAASSMTDLPDAAAAHDSSTSDGALIDAAPLTCSPACNGATPYCDNGTCVQCTSGLHCPLTAPRCVSNACTL